MHRFIQTFQMVPWWLKFAAMGGFGLLSTFAPDEVSSGMKSFFFWLGIVLISGAVIGFIWHFLKPLFKYYQEKLACKRDLSHRIHISHMMMQFQKLEADSIIEFTFEVFNGYRKPITIYSVTGSMNFKESLNASDASIIKMDSSARINKKIGPYRRDIVAFAQPVPLSVKNSILKSLEEKQYFQFQFGSLKIEAFPEKAPQKIFILNLWDGVGYNPDAPHFGRVHIVELKAGCQVTASIGGVK